MIASVGIRSVAAALPPTVRTNDHWRRCFPDLVARADQKTLARLFATSQPASTEAEPFDLAMAPYLADPFRGAVERRVLDGETSLSIEVRAGRAAIEAAGLEPADIDCAVVTSFTPDQQGIGNATFVVRDLGLGGPGWNLESACSSALVALETACALVRCERYRHVLVVLSCSYSRDTDEDDTLSWFMGDGAGAFVVSARPPGYGVLGQHTVHTAATCGTFFHDLVVDPVRGPRPRLSCTPQTQRILRETAQGYLRECCQGAVRAAGVSLDDVALFVPNTPTAWFSAFCARALGVDPERTVDTYPRYANIGPALAPVNLHHAAVHRRIAPGDLVLMFTIGSASTASAAVMRWGEVGVGPEVGP